MSEELKPCPFCGSNQIQFARDGALMIFGVYCRSCKTMVEFKDLSERAETYGENEERYKKAWNRREADEQMR